MSHFIAARFNLACDHFALVSQALDAHQIKVQALVVAEDSINTSFSLPKGAKVTAIAWLQGFHIAVGLVSGLIQIYSATENKIVAELESLANLAVSDIHFSTITNSAWSADAGGNLFEWDVATHSLVQKLNIGDMLESSESVALIATIMHQNEPHLLVGTHNVYLVDIIAKAIVKTFPAHVQPVASFSVISEDLFVTTAKGDRFSNVYSVSRNASRAVLVAQEPIVQLVIVAHGALSQAAALTETGAVELFKDPLNFDVAQDPSKKRRKQLASSVQTKHSDATVKYARPADEIRNADDESLPITAVAATETELYVTWLENGTVSRFDSIPWTQNGEFAYAGDVLIRKSRQTVKPLAHAQKGHDVAAPRLYQETQTLVTEGNAFQSDLNTEEGESMAERLERLDSGKKVSSKKLQKYTAGSLTVVLSQALRNNDHSLLETVLANTEPKVVQSTIARLEPTLAVMLLDRLAELITRQQLRFDQLNFWLKWIIIIHGGVLSLMPNTSNRLASLHSVLTKKATTLPRLLELQGRLRMNEEQLLLRREILGAQERENGDESDVEYVEEFDDAAHAGILGSDSSDDEDADMDTAMDDYVEEDDDEELDEEMNGEGMSDADGMSEV